MEEEQHWEQSLDVDDSDLHSRPLLRPCKHPRVTHPIHPINPTNPTNPTNPVNPTPTINTPDHSQLSESPPQGVNSVFTIPGPAGIVQAAKVRKLRDMEVLGAEECVMATQEYIKMVVQDPNQDDDFKRTPWLDAVEFVRENGGVVYSVSDAPLGDVNKFQRNGKLDQVVAVIKSCTPNELGDMTVTLKDPTGTVSGTIHHKVLTEVDFKRGICIGSVLILHKVSVFSPSRSTHYLNITRRNLVKVFYKDGGSSQNQTFHETIDVDQHHASNNSIHLSLQDSVRGAPTLGSSFSLEQGTERITNRMKRSKMNDEHENINHGQTSNRGANLNIARDRDISREADVIEKDLSSQDFGGGSGTPTLGSVFSLERGTEGITNRMKRSNVNKEQENMNYSQTSNKGTNPKIARDIEILKEANVMEKCENVQSALNSTHVSSQESGRRTPMLGSAFSSKRGTEGITNRMKRSIVNNEQENINYSQTSSRGTNLKITRDKEILKEATDVIEKDGNVVQLSEGSKNEISGIKALLPDWTEEQLLELSVWDDD